MEEPHLELAGLRIGEERALVRQEGCAQAEHGAVGLQGQLAVHVVVAREARRDQVLRALLDPLHGVPEQEGGGGCHHVAGIHRHLVAEAAADVRGDNPDLLLGQPRHQREDRADRVRRLRRHVDRGLAGGRVHVGDAAAGLERRGVTARVEGIDRHHLVRLREGLVRGLLVAGLPVVDVVVLLIFLVRADHGGAGLERALRRDDGFERVVVDLDQLQRVLGDVRVGGDHGRDLLTLEPHGVRDEHGLRVARHRGHPRQVVLRHQLAGHHGDDARQGRGGGGVDAVQRGVGVRTAQDRHVQHPRQMHVIDEVAGTPDESVVFDPADVVSEPADRFRFGGHAGPPLRRSRLRRRREQCPPWSRPRPGSP